MADLGPMFTGSENLDEWANAIDSVPGLGDAQKVDLAWARMADNVRDAIHIVAARVAGPQIQDEFWTWPRLLQYLTEIQRQVVEQRRKRLLKGVACVGGGVAAIVALPAVFVGALGVVGFGASGVAAGSLAAAFQSGIGSVAAGSAFAFFQSAAAGGAAMATVSGVSAAAGAAGAAGGLARTQTGGPSYSWNDGADFIPSPELRAALQV